MAITYQPSGYGQAVQAAAIGAGQAEAATKTLEMAVELAERDKTRRFQMEMANIEQQAQLELFKRQKLWDIEKMETASRIDFTESEKKRVQKNQQFDLDMQSLDKARASKGGYLTDEQVKEFQTNRQLEEMGIGKYALEEMKTENVSDRLLTRQAGQQALETMRQTGMAERSQAAIVSREKIAEDKGPFTKGQIEKGLGDLQRGMKKDILGTEVPIGTSRETYEDHAIKLWGPNWKEIAPDAEMIINARFGALVNNVPINAMNLVPTDKTEFDSSLKHLISIGQTQLAKDYYNKYSNRFTK